MKVLMTFFTQSNKIIKDIIRLIQVNVMSVKFCFFSYFSTSLTDIFVSFKDSTFQKITKSTLVMSKIIRFSTSIRWIQFSYSFFRKLYFRRKGHCMDVFSRFHRIDITYLRTIFSSSTLNSVRSCFHEISTHIARLGKCFSMTLQRPSVQRCTSQRTKFIVLKLRSCLKYFLTIYANLFYKLWETASSKIAYMRAILARLFFKNKLVMTCRTYFHWYWDYTTNKVLIQ